MRDYTEEELKMLSDVLPNIALQLRTSLSTIYTAVDAWHRRRRGRRTRRLTAPPRHFTRAITSFTASSVI